MLGAMVGAHHAAPMPGMGSAVVICLAVLGLATAIALGIRSLPSPLLRGPRLIARRPPLSALTPRPAPARAGPLYLKLAVICVIWHMLTTGELYNDLGGDYHARRNPNSKHGASSPSSNASDTS